MKFLRNLSILIFCVNIYYGKTQQYNQNLNGLWIINKMSMDCYKMCQYRIGSQLEIKSNGNSKSQLELIASDFKKDLREKSKIISDGKECQTQIGSQANPKYFTLPLSDICTFQRTQLQVDYFYCTVIGQIPGQKKKETNFYFSKNVYEQLRLGWRQQVWINEYSLEEGSCNIEAIRLQSYEDPKDFLGTYQTNMVAPFCTDTCKFAKEKKIIFAKNPKNEKMIDIYLETDQTQKSCQTIKIIQHSCYFKIKSQNKIEFYACLDFPVLGEQWILESIVNSVDKKILRQQLIVRYNNDNSCLSYLNKISDDQTIPKSEEKPVQPDKTKIDTSQDKKPTQEKKIINKNDPNKGITQPKTNSGGSTISTSTDSSTSSSSQSTVKTNANIISIKFLIIGILILVFVLKK